MNNSNGSAAQQRIERRHYSDLFTVLPSMSLCAARSARVNSSVGAYSEAKHLENSLRINERGIDLVSGSEQSCIRKHQPKKARRSMRFTGKFPWNKSLG